MNKKVLGLLQLRYQEVFTMLAMFSHMWSRLGERAYTEVSYMVQTEERRGLMWLRRKVVAKRSGF